MAIAVITRDLEGSAPYAAALEALGFEVIVMPVTRTEPPPDPDALVRAVEAGPYAAVVCASARAAGALIRAKGHAPLPLVWCVGQATARVLEQAHVVAKVPEAARDGKSLAQAMMREADLRGRRVLVPRAEDGREELIDILRQEAGAIVEDVIAYRTVPARADDPDIARGRMLLRAGEVSLCTVFSPSQVSALHALVGIHNLSVRFAAIGGTTALALDAAGAKQILIAGSPTPEGIAKAVAAVYPPRT